MVSARQRARYVAFRRFVIGFYSRPFRDVFFQPDPPQPLFNAVVRLLAGYWRPPTITSRLCLEAFYATVWLHKTFKFVDPVPGVGTTPRTEPLLGAERGDRVDARGASGG